MRHIQVSYFTFAIIDVVVKLLTNVRAVRSIISRSSVNKSVFSLIRRLSTRRCPCLLLSVGACCTAPAARPKLHKKGRLKVIRLPSVGFRSWSRFSAVSLQVTWVINPAVGCHYFRPGLQLPPQPLRWLLPISLLGEPRHNGCEQFA